jgi:hypothetical protein
MLMIANKQSLISESHDDLNRFTPCRGNLIHTTCMLPASVHVCHTYASCEQSLYFATFHELLTELNRSTAPEKNGSRPNPQHVDSPIYGSIPSFSSTTTIEAVGKSQPFIGNNLHWFTRPISQTCDQYI